MTDNEKLRLKNQICFPVYAASHLITKTYKPLLDEIGLTYPQYITMMVLWEKEHINVKQLGEELHLESGTLTPMLKRLEKAGYLTRTRDTKDERNVIITLTDKGRSLEKKSDQVPDQIRSCVKMEPDEYKQLYHLLYKIIDQLS